MKLYDSQAKNIGEAKLPIQFKEEIRPDVIKRAVLAIQANKRQPYGAYTRAGKEYSSKLSRRRRDYKTSYGRNLARSPRKTLIRRGTQFIYVGAKAPNTVGGRRSHPPKAEKIFAQKVNKKERAKAIRSAIAATINIELLKSRGYHSQSLVVRDLEKLKKTKEIKQLLLNLGLTKDLERSLIKKLKGGMAQLRGRRYQKAKGPLIVVANPKSEIINASKNLQGFDVVNVNSLNAELLAPGAAPGRLTVWSEAAIEKLDKEKLFLR